MNKEKIIEYKNETIIRKLNKSMKQRQENWIQQWNKDNEIKQ